MSFDFFDSRTDSSVTTNSVPQKKSQEAVSDEATVRNAVTSADLAKLGQSPLPWANASTGSAGVVTAINENRIGGTLCRSFSTTRHAYDGIAAFTGDTCLDANGEWKLVRFTRQN
ncbi:RT0821/Lpp0805 family surface protein [Rhizobiaceae bacterium BDR2-2]|uniref:RT0821/Lpp0805 family surface protein n=2 Tax=Ectorhizobium quercum TaxID=2965071 RepID=A0AAE3N041_9HYPH|nr:RT0821/Lpp0805 family surface protein [Ectorhizobium quercum]MCX8996377.1 RT0821/Lpp0805 family surface protein [Ectorhizobium quercum]MCX8998584.1 RT0821/Lpp0805 family surface protein [Ectorhizobium quercum]